MDAQSDFLQLADEIAHWLSSQWKQTGAQKLILGLSGGLDSAVVCGLSARAIGADRVLAVIMPSHSNPLDAEHARLVATAFGVETVEVDLSPVTDSFLQAMPSPSGNVDNRAAQLAEANIKPRLRMTTLYYLANLHHAMVVGTGNRSEIMIGYFTKHGDSGVDVLPLADLYKWEVRGVARAIGVPNPIIEKAPSAGLWQGQTDENEMGLSYDDLDRALAAIDRNDTSAVPADQLQRVTAMVAASEHKRRPIPAFRRQSR